MDPEDYQQYAHFDDSRNYTRNLISTDHESYTLLLLCWNSGKESPIHDHPCDGCWMRVVTGNVQECRYVKNSSSSDDDSLTCVSNQVYQGTYDTVRLAYVVMILALARVEPLTPTHPVLPHYFIEGQQAFIQDSMGYHKVGNPCPSQPAITLHLYCPPFQQCKIWLDPSSGTCSRSNVCYHSEYGIVL